MRTTIIKNNNSCVKMLKKNRAKFNCSKKCISVIIPVYNADKFVEQAVNSALCQKEVAEVILVEDGSHDNSLNVCMHLKSCYSNVRLIRHKDGQNRGPGATRNRGIIEAGYPYIAFLDADDFYLPDRFSSDLSNLMMNEDADGIYSALGVKFYDIAGQNRYHSEGLTEDQLTTVKKKIKPENLFEEMEPIGNSGYFSCDGLLVKKEIFDKVGLFDTELKIGEDTLMWLKMALKCILIPGQIFFPVTIRGVHSDNTIADKKKIMLSRLPLFQKLYAWAKKEKISKARLELIWLNLYYTEAKYSKTNSILFNLFHLIRYPEIICYKTYRKKIFCHF